MNADDDNNNDDNKKTWYETLKKLVLKLWNLINEIHAGF